MAQLQLTALNGGMKGKIAGTIFQFNKTKQIMRTRRSKTGRDSAFWNKSRYRMATLTSTWKSISEEDRDVWKAYTSEYPAYDKFGNQVQLSGYQLYLKLNGPLVNRGFFPLTVPALPATFPATSFIRFSPHSTVELYTEINPEMPANFEISLFVSPPYGQGRTSLPNQWLYCGVIEPAGTNSNNLLDIWITKYGSVVEFSKVWVKAVILSQLTGEVKQFFKEWTILSDS